MEYSPMAGDLLRFEEFELDPHACNLLRSGRNVRLERIPLDLLILLVERPGQLVTREEIVERLWGSNAFLDTDSAINTAIRKIRQVLRDDREQPRFLQTVSGQGYRFIAQVVCANASAARESREAISAALPQVPTNWG